MRQALRALQAEVARQDEIIQRQEREAAFKQATIDKLTHEMAVLKRLKFAAKSEAFSAEQKSLIEETIDADLAALAREIEQQTPETKAPQDKQGPKREKLPAHLPRREIRHEPESTTCGCGCAMKRIGEDVAEKLDYQPGVFTVERHIRGKWVCAQCETLVLAPVAPHIIDKGIPTSGLLAQVLVAKFLDHLPLYRQEAIFERAGLAIARSTLAQWVGECGAQLQPLVDALTAELLRHEVLHADETPVAMLKPGNGKTHRAYLWSYCTTSFNPVKTVVFDFAESRGGQHVREFLGLPGSAQAPGWTGRLVTDDFSGYKACFDMGVTEVGCMAHARRKFHELWANHGSQVGEQALKFFVALYDVERDVRELATDERKTIRQERARPIADALQQWLVQQRQKVPDGSATARAIDYSLKRWIALTRYIDDGDLPIDNNWVENQIRPIAIGRSNWLFAGSLRAGKRAAAVMSLVHSARLNGVDPYAYLKDVLERLPTLPASRIAGLLPHRWQTCPVAA
ncbi:IS66 family transposase [Ideonella alba]|uniref:IS66 family transposase n=1 Tax=Ideonella alba TaxID=2824118 RepID=A0A941BJB4_9BURK|nr:IS66 family transposase [Ideonella alba]MBQ0933648.1 IS66 family transposase [Ideonella alba]